MVVPRNLAEQVAAQAVATMHTENLVRQAILRGMAPQDAYLKYGKF